MSLLGKKRIITWRKWLLATIRRRKESVANLLAPSLLGRLKFPEPSELARKREVKANPPVRVKRSQRQSLLRLSRSPMQRVKESSLTKVSRFH